MTGAIVPRSVMVVDDSGVFGFTLSLEFRKAGWDIFCCGSGAEALRKLKERDFDLILTDLNMPGMQGDELAKQILSERPAARIILMSSMPRDRVPPLPKGVAFMAKPVNVSMILAAFDKSTQRQTGVIHTDGAAPPAAKP